MNLNEAITSPSEFVPLLREYVGEEFTNWVLGDPVEPLSDAQAGVAAILCSALAADEAVGPGLWARRRLLQLAEFDEFYGTTRLNYLRHLTAGMASPVRVGAGGDPVLEALESLAVAMYGELLLETEKPLMSRTGAPGSPEYLRAEATVRADRSMPFAADGPTQHGVVLHSSTGHGGGIRPGDVAPAIVCSAWELECLVHPAPSLDLLLARLPDQLSNARQALNKHKARAVAVVSLTGILLPPDAILQLNWGRIRPARQSDHPGLASLLQKPLPISRTEAGEELRITDNGDVIVEAQVPLRYSDPLPSTPPEVVWPPQISESVVTDYVTKIRLALLLALDRDPPPVVFSSWSWFIEPISTMGTMGRVDADSYAPRTPTLLTPDEANAWQGWIQQLEGIQLSRLGVAPKRILRAAAERRDPGDRLIDSVICWEALFGGGTELTFKVSASIARLLHPAGPDRRKMRKEAAETYQLRSSIVHGVDVGDSVIVGASQRAMTLTVEVMRVLLRDRRELINMTSVERSTEILMG